MNPSCRIVAYRRAGPAFLLTVVVVVVVIRVSPYLQRVIGCVGWPFLVACPHAGGTAAEVPGCPGRPVLPAVQFTLDIRPRRGPPWYRVSAWAELRRALLRWVRAPPA